MTEAVGTVDHFCSLETIIMGVLRGRWWHLGLFRLLCGTYVNGEQGGWLLSKDRISIDLFILHSGGIYYRSLVAELVSSARVRFSKLRDYSQSQHCYHIFLAWPESPSRNSIKQIAILNISSTHIYSSL